MADSPKPSKDKTLIVVTKQDLQAKTMQVLESVRGILADPIEFELIKRIGNGDPKMETIFEGLTEISRGNVDRGMYLLDISDGTEDGKCGSVDLKGRAPDMPRPGIKPRVDVS